MNSRLTEGLFFTLVGYVIQSAFDWPTAVMPAFGTDYQQVMSETNLTPEQQKRLEARQARQNRVVTREEVLKRNYVERLKEEKAPFNIEPELPQLARSSYETIPEPDVLRLQ
jgi:hypothetical protein